jgi:hypothetical protein
MTAQCRDMTLPEALRDPLVRAVMAADGVDPERLSEQLQQIARQVARRSA